MKMKIRRIMATLLATCLILQLCTGYTVLNSVTKVSAETVAKDETSSTKADSSLEIEVRSSLFLHAGE